MPFRDDEHAKELRINALEDELAERETRIDELEARASDIGKNNPDVLNLETSAASPVGAAIMAGITVLLAYLAISRGYHFAFRTMLGGAAALTGFLFIGTAMSSGLIADRRLRILKTYNSFLGRTFRTYDVSDKTFVLDLTKAAKGGDVAVLMDDLELFTADLASARDQVKLLAEFMDMPLKEIGDPTSFLADEGAPALAAASKPTLRRQRRRLLGLFRAKS